MDSNCWWDSIIADLHQDLTQGKNQGSALSQVLINVCRSLAQSSVKDLSDNQDRFFINCICTLEKSTKLLHQGIVDIVGSANDATVQKTTLSARGYDLLLRLRFYHYMLLKQKCGPDATYNSGLVVMRRNCPFLKIFLDFDVDKTANGAGALLTRKQLLQNRQLLKIDLDALIQELFGAAAATNQSFKRRNSENETTLESFSQKNNVLQMDANSVDVNVNDDDDAVDVQMREMFDEQEDNLHVSSTTTTTTFKSTITAKPNQINFHYIVDINLDYPSMQVFFIRLQNRLGSKIEQYGFILDNPANVSLPMVRQHEIICLETADLNANGNCIPITTFAQYQQASPINVWNANGNIYGIRPSIDDVQINLNETMTVTVFNQNEIELDHGVALYDGIMDKLQNQFQFDTLREFQWFFPLSTTATTTQTIERTFYNESFLITHIQCSVITPPMFIIYSTNGINETGRQKEGLDYNRVKHFFHANYQKFNLLDETHFTITERYQAYRVATVKVHQPLSKYRPKFIPDKIREPISIEQLSKEILEAYEKDIRACDQNTLQDQMSEFYLAKTHFFQKAFYPFSYQQLEYLTGLELGVEKASSLCEQWENILWRKIVTNFNKESPLILYIAFILAERFRQNNGDWREADRAFMQISARDVIAMLGRLNTGDPIKSRNPAPEKNGGGSSGGNQAAAANNFFEYLSNEEDAFSLPAAPQQLACSQAEMENFFETNHKWLKESFIYMLNHGCVSSVISLMYRYSGQSNIAPILCYIRTSMRPNKHTMYILSKWGVTKTSGENYLKDGYLYFDLLYFFLTFDQKNAGYRDVYRNYENVLLKNKIVITQPIVDIFLKYVVMVRRMGSMFVIFTNHHYEIIQVSEKLLGFNYSIESIEDYTCELSEMAYGVFMHGAIFNPYLNEFETAAPSMQSLIVLMTEYKLPRVVLTCSNSPPFQRLLFDCFNKLPSFLDLLQCNKLSAFLLCPIFTKKKNRLYTAKEPNFQQLPYAETKFIVVIEDIYKPFKWSPVLEKTLMQMDSCDYPILAASFKAFVLLMCTMSQQHKLPISLASSFIFIMFGTESNEILGLPSTFANDLQTETGTGGGGGGGVANLTHGSVYNAMQRDGGGYGNESSTGCSDDVLYNQLLTQKMDTGNYSTAAAAAAAAAKDMDIEMNVDKFVDRTREMDDFMTLVNERIRRDTEQLRHQIQHGHIKELVQGLQKRNGIDGGGVATAAAATTNTDGNKTSSNQCITLVNTLGNGTNVLLSEDIQYYLLNCSFDWIKMGQVSIKHLPNNFIKVAFLIYSWILRMGHEHVYIGTAFFQHLISHRIAIYKELERLVTNTIGPLLYMMNTQHLADLFQQFCENSTVCYPEDVEIPRLRQEYDYNGDFYRDPKFANLRDTIYPPNYTPTFVDRELENFKSHIFLGFSTLMLQGEFSMDGFVDIAKFIASINFRGNYGRAALMLHNKSSSGKSVFGNMMDKLFKTKTNKQILTNTVTVSQTKDFDSNALQTACNLLVWINEIENYNVSRLKALIDSGMTPTRTMNSNKTTQYRTEAKVLITCNRPLQIQDMAIGARLFPISRVFQYVSFDDTEMNRRATGEAGGMYNNSTALIGGILLSEKIPDIRVDESIGLFLLNRFLLPVIFFYTTSKPTSMTKSPRGLMQYTMFMLERYPVQYFFTTIKLSTAGGRISKSNLSQFIVNWWNMNKNNFSNTLSQTDFLAEVLEGFSNFKNPHGSDYIVTIKKV